MINKPARGIGRTSLDRVMALASERELVLPEAIRAATAEGVVRGAAARRMPEFLALIDDLRAEAEGQSLTELLSRVLERTGYLRALEAEGSIEAEARLENLRELVSAAGEFERTNREPDHHSEGWQTAVPSYNVCRLHRGSEVKGGM